MGGATERRRGRRRRATRLTRAAMRAIARSHRAEENFREQRRVSETLDRIGRALAAELDLGRLVQRLTDEATALTRAQFGAFFYSTTNEGGEALSLYTLSGAPREAFARFPLPRRTPLFGPTMRGERVVRLDDVTRDPRYGKNPPYHGMPEGHLPVRSYLAVPVVSRSGEVLGVLFFGHGRPGVFTERDEQIVVGVAAQAAIAIDNARLYKASEDARRQAEEAGRLKDEFLSVVSHELRTPLTAVMGWTQILAASPGDADTRARAVDIIERNVTAQVRIIDDILDVSRIITGKLHLQRRPTDVGALARAAIDVVHPAAEAKGIDVRLVQEPPSVEVCGDPDRLQQSFWNLLSNAVKFTPRGGQVTMDIARSGDHVEIAVRDTGAGISREFLPYVFDRFRQADSSSTRRHGGLGLGLAIVRHLVEMHGGTVDVASAGPDRGATFTIRLPAPPSGVAACASARPPAEAPAPTRLDGVRVLVVDDEPDTLEVLVTMLARSGASVVGAASAREAQAVLEDAHPDVIVSDIAMPEEDGYALLRRVRAREPPVGHVPVIALTAYARPEDAWQARRAGFQLHLAKPIEAAALVAAVAWACGRAAPPDPLSGRAPRG